MIDAMVRTKLLATSGVTTWVSTRVYIDSLPQNPTLPALSITLVSLVPGKELEKAWTARVQVSCWSNPSYASGLKSPSEVTSVAASVKAALHRGRLNMTPEKWTVGSTSYDITSRAVTGMPRRFEDPTGWYHVPVDVEITYREV